MSQNGDVLFEKFVPQEAEQGILKIFEKFFKTSERVTKIINAEKRHLSKKAESFFINPGDPKGEYAHDAHTTVRGILGAAYNDPEIITNQDILLKCFQEVPSFRVGLNSTSFADIKNDLFFYSQNDFFGSRGKKINLNYVSLFIENGLGHYYAITRSEELVAELTEIAAGKKDISDEEFDDSVKWMEENEHEPLFKESKTHLSDRVTMETSVFGDLKLTYDNFPLLIFSSLTHMMHIDPELSENIRNNIVKASRNFLIDIVNEKRVEHEGKHLSAMILQEANKQITGYEIEELGL